VSGFGYTVLGFGSHPSRGPAVNTNLYNLASVKAIHETSSSDGVGINFNAGAADSGWMTGVQVIGTDMYVSNRGNNDAFDSADTFITKIAISSTGDGAVVRQNATGLGLNSMDGFALNSDGSKIILADFHGAQIRSGTFAEDGSDATLLNITLNGSALAAGGGVRFARWNNDGSKYYFGYGLGGGISRIKQYETATNYLVASTDLAGTSQELAIEAASDLIFNTDGSKMYISRSTGFIYEYSLSTPYDISTETLVTTFNLTSFFTSNASSSNSPWRASNSDSRTPWLAGLSWNDDGSKLYVITLWGTTIQSKVSGTVNPSTVTGQGGSRTNTMPIIEFRVQ
jgi:hypothetical protein